MASNSGRKSGSSGRSTRKRVVIGAEETVRVRYDKDQPRVESERRATSRQTQRVTSKRAGLTDRPAERAGKRLSHTKKDARNRRQQQIRLRRFAVIGGVVALLALLAWSVIGIYNASVFTVRKVEVEGNRHLTKAQVLAIARVPSGVRLTRLPAAVIEERLRRDPWVDSAHVSRDFPSTVLISVIEREPGAIVDAGGTNVWVVSKDGVWLSARSAEDTGLPVIRDVERLEPRAGAPVRRAEITNALDVIAGLSPELLGQTRAVSAPSVDQTALVTDADVEIFVGEATRIADKDRVAREILKRERGKVVYINVRVVDRPTWRGL